MKLIKSTVFKTFIFFLYLLFCFCACSVKAEQKSLTSQFETIDALISQNQFKDAVKLLKKCEKSSFDSWFCIGIYKRYSLLNENQLAENLLKKSLKKNKSNKELIAVYSKFLLNNKRIDEAVTVATPLKGTDYGSIYSEAILKQASFNSKDNSSFYKTDSFYQIYLDAYNGTKNPIWIRNCAVYNVSKGLYENASMLTPKAFVDSKDAYFWATVNFDSKKYSECAKILEYSSKNFGSPDVETVALESDAYMAISEIEKAENVRRYVTLNIDSFEEKTVADERLLPVIMVNSAIWAKNQKLDERCADLLFYIVNRWPDFVPGLLLYADFAYESGLQREEDPEMKALRKSGLATSEMEKYDNRRKIPLSDALYRINKSLDKEFNPYLAISKLDLSYKTDSSLNEKDKLRNLWLLLEDSDAVSDEYRMLVVQYAVNYLINSKDVAGAWDVFYKYIVKRTEESANKGLKKNSKKRLVITPDNFWDVFESRLYDYDLATVEMAAWFAANSLRRNDALRLHEYCVYESGGIFEDGVISPYVSTSCCVNLANIYYSIGKKDKALDLYGKAAGRESRNFLRSEIFYRIACIYYANSNKTEAVRAADYACALFPENAKASLLKEKLK